MYNLLAIFVGFLLTLMSTLNSGLSNYIDVSIVLVIFHVLAAIISLVLILATKQNLTFKSDLPVLFYIGGVIGFFSVLLGSVCMSNMGASLTVAIIIFGQMVTSAFIDHFGMFGMTKTKFNFKKIGGFFIISVGLALMVQGS